MRGSPELRASRNLLISSSWDFVFDFKLRMRKSMESGIFCFGDLYVARRASISRCSIVRHHRPGGTVRGAFEFQGPCSESQKHQWVPQIVGEKACDMASEMERHLVQIEDCSFWCVNVDDRSWWLYRKGPSGAG